MVGEQNTPTVRAIKASGVGVFEIQKGPKLILARHDLELIWEPTGIQTLMDRKGRPPALVRVPQGRSAIVAATLKPEQIVFGEELNLHGCALTSNSRHMSVSGTQDCWQQGYSPKRGSQVK